MVQVQSYLSSSSNINHKVMNAINTLSVESWLKSRIQTICMIDSDVEFTCQMVGDTVYNVTCVFYVLHVISWHCLELIPDLIDLHLAL